MKNQSVLNRARCVVLSLSLAVLAFTLPNTAFGYSTSRTIAIPATPTAGATITADFSNIPVSATNVSVKVDLYGDYDFTSEYADVTIDGTTPVNNRINPSGSGTQCNTVITGNDADNTRTFSISNTLTSDNALTVTVANSAGVSSTICSSTTSSNRVVVTLTYTSLADLDITSSTAPVGGGSVTVGQPFDISLNFRNIGEQTVTPTYQYRIYECPNANATGCTSLIASSTSANLAVGANRVVTRTLTLPSGTPSGNRYIRTVVDSTNGVTEGYETNNEDYDLITVVQPVEPDLDVSSSTAPVDASSVPAGGVITINYTIFNRGAAFTTDFPVYFYHCQSASTATCSLRATTSISDDFAAGQTRNFTRTFTTVNSAAYPAGTDYIRTRLDATNVITEADETNNEDYDAFTLTKPTLPDLSVVSSTAPLGSSYAAFGNNVSVDFSIRNQGTAFTTNFRVYIYHCPNANATGCSLRLNASITDNFALGQLRSYNRTISLPSGTGNVVDYIRVFVDGANTVTEVSETNNNRYDSISIRSPELSIVSSTAPDSSPGQPISFDYNISNSSTGGGVTDSFSVTHYYCPNANTTDCLVLLGDILILDDFPSGQSRSYSRTFTLPVSATVGARYIRTFIDSGDTLNESNETNNNDYNLTTLSCPVGLGGASCDACDTDYYGYPSCNYCEATTTCNTSGSCGAVGECVCEATFNGPACEYSDTTTCNDQGAAQDDGSCICSATFAGSACQYSDAITCNEGGAAQDDGSCVCSATFAGDACQFSDAVTCNGNGTAQDDGSCMCVEATNGPACEYSDDVDCSGNGLTQEDGSCICDTAFVGAACQHSDATTCADNGTAQDDGSCACDDEFAGSGCQYSDATICMGHGVAQDDGSCVCDEGYSGDACQFSDTTDCSDVGMVQADGSCACDVETAGTNCEFTDATTCSGNGVAQNDGTCVCNDDLEGIACDEAPEPGGCGCSTNGSPISGCLAGLFALGFLLLGTRRRKRNA